MDGVPRLSFDRMMFRRNANIKVQAFILATWFGGGDSSWAPSETTEAYFRNFKIYKLT